MIPTRLFTIDEANALVPRLAHLMERIQSAARALQSEAQAYAERHGRDVASVETAELAREHAPARALMESLDGAIEEVQELGVEVKDLRLGLCDFPARLGGEIVYLCWQTGEAEVAWWHGVHDGFAGRRPLPGVVPTTQLQ